MPAWLSTIFSSISPPLVWPAPRCRASSRTRAPSRRGARRPRPGPRAPRPGPPRAAGRPGGGVPVDLAHVTEHIDTVPRCEAGAVGGEECPADHDAFSAVAPVLTFTSRCGLHVVDGGAGRVGPILLGAAVPVGDGGR